MAQRFRIAAGIVHETVDGEVIAIDLESGAYYSLAGSGPAIWEMLAAGVSEAEAAEALAGRFGGAEGVAADVAALFAELRESGLVAVAGEGEGAAAPALGELGDSYEAPRFERYTDMKDFFLLDPIHEVDATGWPKPAA